MDRHDGQLTLDHARERTAFESRAPAPAGLVSGGGARAHARHEAHAVARRGASPSGSSPSSLAKARALARVERLLLEYIAHLGVGATFQAIDFTNHMHALGEAPSPDVCDPRAVGGLYRRLQDKGLIAGAGSRFCVGGTHTGAHGSLRNIWKVMRETRAADASLRTSGGEVA